MDYAHNKKMQDAIRAWVDVEKWDRPLAFTLTHKNYIWSDDAEHNVPVYLNGRLAFKNFRHFMSTLNKGVFGNAHERYGKKLKVFAVMEGSKTKHRHYHGVIGCPKDMPPEAFKQMISKAWLQTDWGHLQTDVKSYANNGWISYITKLRDKYGVSVADSIDWENCCL